MYDEIVKRLRDIATSDSNIKSNYIGLSLLQAADAIEDLQAQLMYSNDAAKAIAEKVPKWIPVTERLPEIDEKHHCSKDVLAYLKGGYLCFTALEENIFGQTWFECERNPAIEEEMIVTHWQPLPEPPDHIGEATEMVEKESES